MSQPYTLLYIEDDTDSRRLVSRVLKNAGYDVVVAGDGLEGIALALSVQPHLVLMDINLPGMDGRAVTTRLRSLPGLETVPVVALTADNLPGSRELALAAGCVGFLTKPVDVDRLPEQVDSFLNGLRHTLQEDMRYEQLERHAQDVVQQLEGKVRQLEEVNQRLHRLDRLKSDFITLASHELRTPLTLVTGYAQLLEMQIRQFEATGQPWGDLEQRPLSTVEKLNHGLVRLAQVVDEIISLAHIATDRLDLQKTSILPADIVTAVIAAHSATCRQRQIQLHVAELSHLPPIQGDIAYLKTAVANIVENAIKYTPNGRAIYISGQAQANSVTLQVRDTGIGIAPEDQALIFDQFYVVGSIDHHSSSKSAFMGGGLGMGLAVAQGIVAAHDGRIWVESVGQDFTTLPGSTFYISLPRA